MIGIMVFWLLATNAGGSPSDAKAAASVVEAPKSEVAFPGQYATGQGDGPVSVKGCYNKFPKTDDRLTCLRGLLNDYPRLDRFANANAELAPPAKNEKRVVFFGDSITDFWSQKKNGGFFPGKPYVNRGIGGQTTAQMLLRFRADVLALKPKAVVILAGTNDIGTGVVPLDAIKNNLMTMVELARLHKIQVVLASLLPVRDGELAKDGKPIIRTTIRPPKQIAELNQWIATYARTERLVHLDYHFAMMDDRGYLQDELTDDGLHPNPQGYAVMAGLVEKALGKALR